MTDRPWLKVELRKSYVTQMGVAEETQTVSRAELEEEQRQRIRQARERIEGQSGLNTHQRREMLAQLPDPDAYTLDNFEELVLETAQKWARSPVVDEVNDRIANIYPPFQVLRVTVDVLEVG